MEYTLQSGDEFDSTIKVRHESNEPFITIFITKRDDDDFKKPSFCDIDLNKNELHDFIGTLLHIQSKMRK